VRQLIKVYRLQAKRITKDTEASCYRCVKGKGGGKKARPSFKRIRPGARLEKELLVGERIVNKKKGNLDCQKIRRIETDSVQRQDSNREKKKREEWRTGRRLQFSFGSKSVYGLDPRSPAKVKKEESRILRGNQKRRRGRSIEIV